MKVNGLTPGRVTAELQILTHLFYASLDEFGQFREVAATDMPPIAQELLAHDEHMTVTLEAHHGCSVDVEVLDSIVTKTHYARRILLRCGVAGNIVQFGIVRLNLSLLDEEVRREIESEAIPLGRTLINHDVLRKVRLLSLWEIMPGSQLSRFFGSGTTDICFGRTALIYCNDVPAVELLEIVTTT